MLCQLVQICTKGNGRRMHSAEDGRASRPGQPARRGYTTGSGVRKMCIMSSNGHRPLYP
jgi:hypothetical protein